MQECIKQIQPHHSAFCRCSMSYCLCLFFCVVWYILFMAKQEVIPLDPLDKIPLTIPLFVNCINAGMKQYEIAGHCNISEQAVSDFKLRHLLVIQTLLNKNDSNQSIYHRYNVLKASQNLSICLEKAQKKSDIIANVAVIDRLDPVIRKGNLEDNQGNSANMQLIEDALSVIEKIKASLT